MTDFQTVDEIPSVEREGRGSKYAEVFEAVEKAAPKAIIVATFTDEVNEEGEPTDEANRKAAANRASYLREVAPEGVTVAQRGNQVFAQVEQETEDTDEGTDADEAEVADLT